MFSNEDYQSILHEIKNSICLIGGSLQLIAKQHPEVQDFRYWNETMADISNLTQLFQDISAAKVHTNIQKEIISTKDFLLGLQSELPNLLSEKIHFSFDIQPNLPDAYLDPTGIRHVMINLVKNASEAITDTGFIKIAAFIQEDSLCIRVTDNGCGIAADKMDKIFTPVYSSKSDGMGLGLSITKKIIDSHQGSILCESKLNEGTAFTILLPLQ